MNIITFGYQFPGGYTNTRGLVKIEETTATAAVRQFPHLIKPFMESITPSNKDNG